MTPRRPLRPCSTPGCRELVDKGKCEAHQVKAEETRKVQVQRYDQARGTAAERGYTAQWSKVSRAFRYGKVCVMCEAQGVVKMSQCTDHIIAVSGPDDPLFWVESNWQPLCINHHSEKTAKEDGSFGNCRISPT